ncbi:Glutamate receptor ionotropic, kainate 2 [Chionoecetes opilio]|uniref:Glutamate receptor ionotropic, kainate 2 n=1 Tax=Chionoecetes opilio TaxID=41210 RepID=A0A8J4XWT0_CHIOP|nr:Glutamate receptor ionotropic, kainate 2 [Chionoecetes opilio]
MFDAVVLFASALTTLDKSGQVTIDKLYCTADDTWQHGSSLINYMKWYGSRAITAPSPNPHMQPYSRMNYNPYNPRPEPHVPSSGYYGPGRNMTYMMEQVRVVGKWTRHGGANFTRNWALGTDPQDENLQNRTLYTSPYTMLRQSSGTLTGNDRFEGFCIDIIKEIARQRGFNYSLVLSPDGGYGSKNRETGKWDGIIKELLDHKADLGIVDFTITYEREEAVDFTMPFMNLGISIIYSKPQKKSPSLFSFMSPFSVDVWIYMATAYLGVSVLLFILARMAPEEWDCPYPCIEDPDELENCFTLLNSMWFIIGTFLCQGADIAPKYDGVAPQEWDNPHPCIQDPDELENSISLSNAFWFTIGSVMQQGSDIAPKAVSTRIVAGIWWFFTLIMISSYTANLAAFLTVERMDAPIESAEDLAKQTKIKYGCKKDGSTYKFFMDSNIPTYMKMWTTMSSARPSVFTETNEEGVERAEKSKGMYAFLMESSSIEYEVERRCNLMQIGGLLDSKSYGVALPPGSPYTDKISSAILRMKENGTLHRLKDKWWKADGRCQLYAFATKRLRYQGVNDARYLLLPKKCRYQGQRDARSSVTASAKTGGAAELGLANVGGVFVVLIGGMGVAAFMAICEFMWNARDLATDESASFCDELSSEVRFIMKCSGNTKPVRKKAPATPEEPLFTYGSYAQNNYSTEVKKDSASAAELGLENVGGVFVVMVGGIMLAMMVACCEFMWKARKLATDDGCHHNSAKKAPLTPTSSNLRTLKHATYANYGYNDKK